MLFFLLNYLRILVESAFYITKKGGGESFCEQTGHDGKKYPNKRKKKNSLRHCKEGLVSRSQSRRRSIVFIWI